MTSAVFLFLQQVLVRNTPVKSQQHNKPKNKRCRESTSTLRHAIGLDQGFGDPFRLDHTRQRLDDKFLLKSDNVPVDYVHKPLSVPVLFLSKTFIGTCEVFFARLNSLVLGVG
jgi:hypothetical protein